MENIVFYWCSFHVLKVVYKGMYRKWNKRKVMRLTCVTVRS